MKSLLLATLILVSVQLRAEGDNNLAAGRASGTSLIIGIVIAILVIVAIYFLLRKNDR